LIEIRYWVDKQRNISQFSGYITLDKQWVGKKTISCWFSDLLLAYQVMNDYYFYLPTDDVKEYYLVVARDNIISHSGKSIQKRNANKKGT